VRKHSGKERYVGIMNQASPRKESGGRKGWRKKGEWRKEGQWRVAEGRRMKEGRCHDERMYDAEIKCTKNTAYIVNVAQGQERDI